MCVILFIIVLFFLIVVFGAGIDEARQGNHKKTNTTNTYSQSKHMVIKKNGQSKRYRINKYGEIFDDN